ncbi:MAG: hypothetical protein ACYSW3_27355, partial [Planctomycetota bacterium]
MKWSIICVVLILAATICSVALRLPDPNEYHGPTLNYLTLIPAWCARAQKSTDLSETTLRIVPVFFGVLLVLLLLLMVDGLGRAGSICAAV